MPKPFSRGTRRFQHGNIVVVDSRKVLSDEKRALVENFLWEGFSTTQGLLAENLWNTKVEVLVRRGEGIPEWGLAGAAKDRDLIQITIDPDNRNLWSPEFSSRLVRLAGHEGFHVLEGYTMARPLVQSSLGQALISEGKAQNFEREVSATLGLGGSPSFYSVAVQGERLAALEKLAIDRLHKPYDHMVWFFGSLRDKLPRHGGYSLGNAVVAEWCVAENTTAARILHEPAETILAWWRDRYAKGQRFGLTAD